MLFTKANTKHSFNVYLKAARNSAAQEFLLDVLSPLGGHALRAYIKQSPIALEVAVLNLREGVFYQGALPLKDVRITKGLKVLQYMLFETPPPEWQCAKKSRARLASCVLAVHSWVLLWKHSHLFHKGRIAFNMSFKSKDWSANFHWRSFKPEPDFAQLTREFVRSLPNLPPSFKPISASQFEANLRAIFL